MVAANIFTPNKGFIKPQDNGEKTFGKDHANKYTKVSSNKDQCTNGNKKKEGKEYKGQNKLSPTDLERYLKENQCFRLKELHKHHIFYPHMMMKCQVHLNSYILGEE